jgi:hypothetical protein
MIWTPPTPYGIVVCQSLRWAQADRRGGAHGY